MSYHLPPLPLPLKHRRKSESTTDPPGSPPETWISDQCFFSSSPTRSSPSPVSPTTSKYDIRYPHIFSSPRLGSELAYSRADDVIDDMSTSWSGEGERASKSHEPNSSSSHRLPSFRSSFPSDEELPLASEFDISDINETSYTKFRQSAPQPPDSSSVFYSDSEEEEDDGYEFAPSDSRSTYFSTSAERGRWQTDPLPISMRTRSSGPTTSSSSISKPPIAPRPISEPAPPREPEATLLTPEEDTEVEVKGDVPGGCSIPDTSLEPDHSDAPIAGQSCGDIVTEELPVESEVDEVSCPSSPLPPSSAPVSPMSTCVSPTFGPISPMSISPSSPLSSVPPSPLLLPTTASAGTPDGLTLDVLASGACPLVPGNEDCEAGQAGGDSFKRVTADCDAFVVIPTSRHPSPTISLPDAESRPLSEAGLASCEGLTPADVSDGSASSSTPISSHQPQETLLRDAVQLAGPILHPQTECQDAVEQMAEQDLDIEMAESDCPQPKFVAEPAMISLPNDGFDSRSVSPLSVQSQDEMDSIDDSYPLPTLVNPLASKSHQLQTIIDGRRGEVVKQKSRKDLSAKVRPKHLEVENKRVKPSDGRSEKGKEKIRARVETEANEKSMKDKVKLGKEAPMVEKEKAARKAKGDAGEKPKRKSKHDLGDGEGAPRRKKPRTSSDQPESPDGPSTSTSASSSPSINTSQTRPVMGKSQPAGAKKQDGERLKSERSERNPDDSDSCGKKSDSSIMVKAKVTKLQATEGPGVDKTIAQSAPKRPTPKKQSHSDPILPSSTPSSETASKPPLRTAASEPAPVQSTSQRSKANRSSFEAEDSASDADEDDDSTPDESADAEIEGMLIESMALSRASSHPATSLVRSLIQSRPTLGVQRSDKEWLTVVRRVLRCGDGRMFGKVESSGKDDADRPLEAQWFYVPEMDPDQERATLLRALMPRAGKRSVTKKYKQYYYQPLDKISRWDPEDAI